MYKKLLQSVREYKRPSLEAPFYVSLEVVMECIIPFIVARLVNSIREGSSFSVLMSYGVVLVVMACLSLTFGIIAGNACSTASCGFAKNLRSDIFRAVQGFSFENLNRFPTSSLVTRLTTDVSDVQQAYMMIVRTAIRGPLMLVFSFIMALIMGGRIAFIFLFTAPFLGLGLFAIASWAMPTFRRLFREYDEFNNTVQENIQGIRAVKAFVREEYEKERFSRRNEAICRNFTRVERILALNNPMMQFCLYVVMIFVLYYGTYRAAVSHGLDIDVGQISSLLTYGMQILGSLMRLSMVFVMITLARESAVRIVEVLEEVPAIPNPPDGLKEIPDGSVEFEGVSFSYSNTKSPCALTNITMKIPSGSTIGIIGATGSSKTTLIQLIPRLYDAASGSVKVGGHDVREYDIKALRSAVSLVLQKNEIFSGTVRDNLKWGDKNATDEEISEACRISCCDEFIGRLPQGYDTFTEQSGTNFSGGQKQRLCIARALLKRPKVLILDDALSAVDTHTDAKIRRALKDYMPETTKIIIAQRISSVEDADRIILMEGGRIRSSGTHRELMETDNVYREIYNSQNAGRNSDA
ncbi:MAG: ABC transporter ATP-binding protein [Synergistaceae bacterium]|nr:ABC transporter ATP-binding protein [Synergistaceae bacterium]